MTSSHPTPLFHGEVILPFFGSRLLVVSMSCSARLQFNYQENIKNCVVLIYDPSRKRAAGLALRAFRLTETFMTLYKDGKITFDALATANQTNGTYPTNAPLTPSTTLPCHSATVSTPVDSSTTLPPDHRCLSNGIDTIDSSRGHMLPPPSLPSLCRRGVPRASNQSAQLSPLLRAPPRAAGALLFPPHLTSHEHPLLPPHHTAPINNLPSFSSQSINANHLDTHLPLSLLFPLSG